MRPPIVHLSAILILTITAAAQQATVVVDGTAKGLPLPSTLHGIFLEEINRSGDGGLHAEMLSNRSFEENPERPVDWRIEGQATLDRDEPLHPNNPTHLRIKGPATLTAAGFKERGFRVNPCEPLTLRFWTRMADNVRVDVALVAKDGKTLAIASADLTTKAWAKHELGLKPSAADPDSRLVLRFSGPLRLDMVSLMPAGGWRGLPLRKDLAELLAAMKPRHIRFPGGCYVEGETMAFAHRWKDTIGPVEERPLQAMRWGYHSTGGFGVLEFLLWCEALGAEPVYVLNAGMSHQEDVSLDRMQPFVQDAVDFMEYATGGSDTEWGAKRIAHGRKQPFRIQYLEIGNENGGTAYEKRFELFHDALKARWPDLKIIANKWDRRVPLTRKLDVIDEHYYRPSTWFRQASQKYDAPGLRGGPGIYVGEYASSHDAKPGTLRGALADASFLAGLERNCDLVTLAAYAPLLCHEDWGKWSPNAIHFNHRAAWGKPSYHAQRMFASTRGEVVLPCNAEGPGELPAAPAGGVSFLTAIPGASFADLRITAPDGGLLAGGPDTRWGLAKDEFRREGETFTRTSTRPRDLGAIRIGDPRWGNAYDLSCRVRLPVDLPARTLNWKSGMRVNVLGDRFTIGLGNWGNHVHTIEGMNLAEERRGSLEPGKWHEVRISVRGQSVNVLLDGKLATGGTQQPIPVLCASAQRTANGSTIVLRLINNGPVPLDTLIDLGAVKPTGNAAGWILSHATPEATNTEDQAESVFPKPLLWDKVGPRHNRRLPAFSLSVVSIPLH
jgi:alpha-L-arabinofuranosidase